MQIRCKFSHQSKENKIKIGFVCGVQNISVHFFLSFLSVFLNYSFCNSIQDWTIRPFKDKDWLRLLKIIFVFKFDKIKHRDSSRIECHSQDSGNSKIIQGYEWILEKNFKLAEAPWKGNDRLICKSFVNRWRLNNWLGLREMATWHYAPVAVSVAELVHVHASYLISNNFKISLLFLKLNLCELFEVQCNAI